MLSGWDCGCRRRRGNRWRRWGRRGRGGVGDADDHLGEKTLWVLVSLVLHILDPVAKVDIEVDINSTS